MVYFYYSPAMSLTASLCFFFSLATSLLVGAEEQKQIFVAVLADSSVDGSQMDAYNVGELALALINNSTSILPDYHLQLIRGSGGCNDPPGLSPFLAAAALGGIGPNPAVIGMIGPLCSSSAVFLGSLIGREELSLVDIHLGVSALLNSHSNYSNSFGIVGSSSLFHHSVVELIRMNNWSVVSLLYDDSLLYHSSAVYELANSALDNVTINEYYISSTLTYIPLDYFKFESRITILFMREELVRKVLCTAYHAGFVFPAYQFVIVLDSPLSSMVSGSISFTTLAASEYSCSIDALAAGLEGSILVSFETLGVNVSLSDHMYSSYNLSCEEQVSICEDMKYEQLCFGTVDSTFIYLFDAFWSLALALHNSQLKPEQLSFSRSGFVEQSEAIKQELFQLEFNGFSGPIRFDQSTSFTRRNISLHQYVRGELVLLGTLIDGDTRVLEIDEQGAFLPWNISTDRRVVFPYLPRVCAVLAFVVTVSVLFLLIALHTLTVIYRNAAEVKASSFKMLQLAYAGCYMLILSSFVHIALEGWRSEMDLTTSCYLWHVLTTFHALGFTTILSTLCLRTWRLYRIFIFYTNPGRFLSDYPLMVGVFACVLLNGLIALVWVVVDPLQPTIVGTEKELNILRCLNGSVEDVVVTEMITLSCLVKEPLLFYLWFILLYTFYFILTLFLAGLVILTRKIPQKKFKTQNILRLDYMLTVFGSLVTCMYLTLQWLSTPEVRIVRFVLFPVAVDVGVVLICSQLYFPIVWPAFKATAKRFSCFC